MLSRRHRDPLHDNYIRSRQNERTNSGNYSAYYDHPYCSIFNNNKVSNAIKFLTMNPSILLVILVVLALVLTIIFVFAVIKRHAIEPWVQPAKADHITPVPAIASPDKKKSPTKDRAGTQGRQVFALVWTIGLIGMLLYSIGKENASAATIFANSLLIAGGALFIGGLLGFLFGIPRTLQEDPVAGGAGNSSRNGISYKVNTNLEQISDWLTKILVGIGLTQLAKLPIHVNHLADSLKPGLGNDPESGVYGISVIVFFISTGFLSGYMVTRIYIGRIFQAAEKSYLEKKIDEIQLQSNINAAALDIASQLLSPTTTEKSFTEKEVSDAFEKASRNVRLTIFTDAATVRKNNRKTNKKFMEKAIPVFRALIASEVEHRDHRYFGELGFALKDKENPDFLDAQKNLTAAITIRGDYNEYGYTIYEFNRAICNINLDANFKQGIESADTVKKSIREDFEALAKEVGGVEFFEYGKWNPEIKKWLTLNQIVIS
jgi:hypothetical protein